MSGLFSTFNITKRGMQAQQTALHIVSHNIANANTEGYSVQRAELKTTQPFGMPSLTTSAEPGQLGTGVQVAKISRTRDVFLDAQIRKEKSTLGKYESRQQFLSEIETIFMEPSDTGLSSVLGKFYDSWSQLSNTPEPNSTARTLVVQNAQALCTAINQNYQQLSDMEANAADITSNEVFEAASILSNIQELNVQIKAAVIGGKEPNDLLDRRDLLLDQLSQKFSYDTEETDFKGIKIYAKVKKDDGTEDKREILKDGSLNFSLSYINKIDYEKNEIEIYIDGDINNKKTISVSDASEYKNIHVLFYDKTAYSKGGTIDASPAKFINGSINGYETIYEEIEKYKTQLNNIARALTISANTIHSDGNNIDFFNKDAEDLNNEPAKIISVNKSLVDDPKNIVASINSNEGNGERALAIARLRNIRMDVTGIDSRAKFISDVSLNTDKNSTEYLTMKSNPNGITIDNYFKSTISALGVSSQEAERMVTNQNALLSQLETRRESISGVSIDEEITNMIQFQRSYEANAKMISVIDQLLDVVVNGLIRR
ncbi:flagellar hook-associated protein 1 FlgK [Caloramator quimbayensis]|uniref:Flagellar hook-associated protein 1 n=1 Tax=Caloramator quimbayensis TaxID=1147123 RepID=A0A1T4X9B6_9CLOT|nr:flagellar hook-associated protein FlgK [Caloramator quimbayensis]SKA86153.1 flagellar hook-associated protein 1 FlgK [Caloramator quimbayensis]